MVLVQSFEMHFMSASAHIYEWDNDSATIANLYSQVRRQRHASELMDLVIAWAEAHRLTLQLRVRRYGHPIGPTNRQLVEFYERYGFVELVPSDGSKSEAIFMQRLLKGDTDAATESV